MWKHGLVGAVLVGSAWGQVTQRVSVNDAGRSGNRLNDMPAMSADGRFVAFESTATNLVPGDTNGKADIFVRDRVTGHTELVSVDSAGVQGNADSIWPKISADGRFVAFTSYASNLVPGDANGKHDVFRRDRLTGETIRVSVGPGGAEANDYSGGFGISADGRFVSFWSVATNLITSTTSFQEVFLHDCRFATTELASGPTVGFSDGDSWCGQVSSDARYVVFCSSGDNLVVGDTNLHPDVFVRDRSTGTVTRVSVDSRGHELELPLNADDSIVACISPDGRYVGFDSLADNLVADDTNHAFDVFVHDRVTGLTDRVSLDSSGNQGNTDSGHCGAISEGGRHVTFSSWASNLVPDDSNQGVDFFLRDRLLGTTERLSVTSQGAQIHSFLSTLSVPVSADGRWAAFDSDAPDVVPGESNGGRAVFVRDRFGGPGFTNLCTGGRNGVLPCPCSNPSSDVDRGCDNSDNTGGSVLSASGGTLVSSDSLEFSVRGEPSAALSILLQGTAPISTGLVYGQGVRCVGGSITRLGAKRARGGSITIPDFEVGDPQVTAVSATKGDLIHPGDSRYYFVFYRDPIVLGGCPSTSTFNATTAGLVEWAP